MHSLIISHYLTTFFLVSNSPPHIHYFHRYARALFRRAACLLEKGDALGAVEGFKSLYRVDRNWPSLPDWLVRAFSLQKRQAKGYKGSMAGGYDDEEAPANTPSAKVTA